MKTAMIPALALLALAPLATAQSSAAFQIRAKEVLLHDGTTIENGVVVVDNGRIRSVGKNADSSLALIEHDGVLSAGMVVCHSHFGAAGEVYDETRSVMPDARLVYAFNPKHSDFDKAVAAGVTSMVLAPSKQNVAGGVTAVVKSAGGKVLKKEAHLALSFSHESLEGGAPPPFFFFDVQDDTRTDGGVEETGGATTAGARFPTSYAGALAALRNAFTDPEGSAARAAAGELPVLLEAWDRNEVARAIAFAKEQKLSGALRGAPLAIDQVDPIKASGLGVVVGPFRTGHHQRSLESVKALAQAGVPMAFALGSAHPNHLRMSAAMAIGAGADARAVWRALTSDAASLAGVGANVGKLEAGMDADLVLWSGHPMNLSSRVVHVYVDGKHVSGGAK